MTKVPSHRVDVGQIVERSAPPRLSTIQRIHHESGRNDDHAGEVEQHRLVVLANLMRTLAQMRQIDPESPLHATGHFPALLRPDIDSWFPDTASSAIIGRCWRSFGMLVDR